MNTPTLPLPTARQPVVAPMTASILLVQHPGSLRDSRELLLHCLRCTVHVAETPADVFNCGPNISFSLVAIDLRDAKTTERLAFYARRRWPRAKILLLGRDVANLQDSLYDDVVDPCCNPVGFVETCRRLIKSNGSQ